MIVRIEWPDREAYEFDSEAIDAHKLTILIGAYGVVREIIVQPEGATAAVKQ